MRCPTRNALDVYKNFLKNVEEFQKINSLPVKIDFGEEGTATNFLNNKVSWLQKEAFQVANSECSFEEWRHDMIEKSPTFQYWDFVS